MSNPKRWANFKDAGYPDAPIDNDPKRAEIVHSVADKLQSTAVKDLVGLYNQAREFREARLAEAAEHQIMIDALEFVIIQKLKELGTTSFNDGHFAFSVSSEPYPQTEDRAKVIAWLKEEGLEDLLTINAQTLSSTVKNRLAAGDPEPPGVKISCLTRLHRAKV